MSSNPYATQQRQAMEVGKPKNVEAWALIQLAHRLDQACKTPDDQENIRDTVRLNWRIWTIFQAELSNPESTATKEIRENLLNLSNFIDKRSLEIISTLNDIPVEKLDVLININRHIGNGLLGNKVEDGDIPSENMVEKITESAPSHENTPSSDTSPVPEEAAQKFTDLKI